MFLHEEKLLDLKNVLPLMKINENNGGVNYVCFYNSVDSLFECVPINDNMFFLIVKIAKKKIPNWFMLKYGNECDIDVWKKYVE
jgi:hypothetical protein